MQSLLTYLTLKIDLQNTFLYMFCRALPKTLDSCFVRHKIVFLDENKIIISVKDGELIKMKTCAGYLQQILVDAFYSICLSARSRGSRTDCGSWALAV